MEITIRILTKDDANDFYALRLEALKDSPESFASTYEETINRPDPLKHVQESLESKDALTFGVFVNNKELVAVAILRFIALEKLKHKAHILGMYVSPRVRKQGIGKKLIEFIIREGKKRELEQLQLAMVTTNSSAKKLYETLGFQPFGYEKKALKWNGQYWDEEHMVLYL